MTLIAGIRYEGVVYLLGDALSSSGGTRENVPAPKVVRLVVPVCEPEPGAESLVLGVAGRGQMGLFFLHQFAWPAWDRRDDPLAYLTREVRPALRAALKDDGVAIPAEGGNQWFALLGFAGRLFVLYHDLDLWECGRAYDAIGSGDALALGVLHATATLGSSPRACLQAAALAASEHRSDVGPPFTIVDTSEEG